MNASLPLPRYQQLSRAVVFSCVLIGLEGSGYALSALLLTEAPPTVAAALVPFCFIMSTYSFDRVVNFDPVADARNHPERVLFGQRWGAHFKFVAAGVFLLGLVLCANHSGLASLLYLCPVLGVPIYGSKLLPVQWRFRRLKDIPGVKTIYTSLAWGCVCGLLPVVLCDAPLSATAWWASSWVCLRMAVNTLLGDWYDIEGDKIQRTLTVAVLLGRQPTYWMVQGLNLVVGGLILIATLAGDLPAFAHWLNLSSVIGIGVMMWWGQASRAFSRWYYYASEAEGAVFGAVALAARWLTAL